LRPVSTALADIPALAVTDAEAQALRYGQSLALADFGDLMLTVQDGDVLQAQEGGCLVGLCRVQEDRLKPIRIFESFKYGDRDVDYS